MSQVEITGLFPTPFARVRGILPRQTLQQLVDGFDEGSARANAKSTKLSHSAVLSPESSPLYEEVAQAVTPSVVGFGQLLFGERLPWAIKEMWTNRLLTGGRQEVHSHANSFASGVLYLTPVHDSAPTVLYRGMGGRDFSFSNDHEGSEPGEFNSPKWAPEAVLPGDLILFPSYLLHEVPENRGPVRMTLAFNAIPERLQSWGYGVNLS